MILRAAICAPAAIRAEVVLMFSAVFAVKTCSNSTVITQVTVIAEIIFADRVCAGLTVIAFITIIIRLFRTVIAAAADPIICDVSAAEFAVCFRIPSEYCCRH